jgi:hypothetical protein
MHLWSARLRYWQANQESRREADWLTDGCTSGRSFRMPVRRTSGNVHQQQAAGLTRSTWRQITPVVLQCQASFYDSAERPNRVEIGVIRRRHHRPDLHWLAVGQGPLER